jgi:hypothetical protein
LNSHGAEDRSATVWSEAAGEAFPLRFISDYFQKSKIQSLVAVGVDFEMFESQSRDRICTEWFFLGLWSI